MKYTILILLTIITLNTKTYTQTFPDTISVETITGRRYSSDTIFTRYKIKLDSNLERWDTYYMNGQKAGESTYLNDNWHGTHYSWFKNGKIQSRHEYNNGHYSGESISYYENGNIESEADFSKHDTVELRTYYKNGNLKSIETTDDQGYLVGKRISYYENGQIAHYDNFIWSIDSVVAYYENGNLMKRGFSEMVRFNCGKWFFYYEDGTIEKIEFYTNCVENYAIPGENESVQDGKLLKEEFYNRSGELISIKEYE